MKRIVLMVIATFALTAVFAGTASARPDGLNSAQLHAWASQSAAQPADDEQAGDAQDAGELTVAADENDGWIGDTGSVGEDDQGDDNDDQGENEDGDTTDVTDDDQADVSDDDQGSED